MKKTSKKTSGKTQEHVIKDTIGVWGVSETKLEKGHPVNVTMKDGQKFLLSIVYVKQTKSGYTWLATVKKGEGVTFGKYRLQKATIAL